MDVTARPGGLVRFPARELGRPLHLPPPHSTNRRSLPLCSSSSPVHTRQQAAKAHQTHHKQPTNHRSPHRSLKSVNNLYTKSVNNLYTEPLLWGRWGQHLLQDRPNLLNRQLFPLDELLFVVLVGCGLHRDVRKLGWKQDRRLQPG